MKADPKDQAKLLDIAQIDDRIAKLQSKKKQLLAAPELAEQKAQLQELKGKISQHKDELVSVDVEISKLASDVKLAEDRIKRNEQIISTSANPKDAQALLNEITNLQSRISDLETTELEKLELKEELVQLIANVEGEVQALNHLIATTEVSISEQLETINTDGRWQLAAREKLTSEISTELVALYEKQKERYGAGVSRLEGKISSATGIELHAAALSEVLKAAPDDVLMCPDSNAILVRV